MATRNRYCVKRLPQEWLEWVEELTPLLDSRTAWRLPIVLAGLLLARGGRPVTKKCKTFLATWPVVGGVIRVVIVRESDRWEAFFSTDPTASVESILECFADRATIEQVFHDIKEVWGAEQQQVRNLFTNVACYHLNLWMQTLVELWAWNQCDRQLCDRSLSPWDWMPRRPSHADKRNALRRTCFQNELSHVELNHQIAPQIKKLLKTLASLAA